MHKPLVALIGNPNCGKTTLFNQLTGLNKKTGNWSGVTVDSSYCAINFNDLDYNLVDLPGIYALSIDSQGEDESHVKEFLQQHQPQLIINVLNATTLERGLFLTLELLKFGIPVISVLNMWDEAQQHNYAINLVALEQQLQSKVVTTVAKKGEGVAELKQSVHEVLKQNKKKPPANSEKINFEHTLASAKKLSQKVLKKPKLSTAKSHKLDTITTHPVWGMAVFFLAMYVMFFFAINVSSVLVDFFDLATGAILIDGGHHMLETLGVGQWLTVLLADGIGGGIQTVATFIPVIGFLYLVLTWLEDSGYMARAAFVMNGVMQKIGLSGKAFVPLIVSFGCNVPAIMATRTLPSRRERLVTIMMAPFMSCGARLSVYALFVSAFFSQNAAAIVFTLYFTGILMAILTGKMLQKTILPGKAQAFIIELPPWRLPTIKNLLYGTWNRLKSFLIGAGKIIVLMVMLIQVLNSIGKDFSFGNQDSENSMLSAAAKTIAPVFKPMGIEERNWPAIVGILTGVLAKEVVVGTLDALYSSLDEQAQTSTRPSVKEGLVAAVKSIKTNAIALKDLILDPLGFSIVKADNQTVDKKVFAIIHDRFSDNYAVFAYLLFILLYFPCVAATAAISREANFKWALFSGFWSTSLAYLVATNFYQFSQFNRHPWQAISWFAALIFLLSGVYYYLKKVGNRQDSLQLNVL